MSRLSGLLVVSLLALSALPLEAVAESGKLWMIYGGDAANTRFSVLSQINTQNVAKLKVAWIAQLSSARWRHRNRRL
jgi:glucose dehydrogenase